VKSAIDAWAEGAQIKEGRLFRCVSRKESVWGTGITEKVIWHVVLVKNGAGTEPRAIDREKGGCRVTAPRSTRCVTLGSNSASCGPVFPDAHSPVVVP
jgi:hypothetical protein